MVDEYYADMENVPSQDPTTTSRIRKLRDNKYDDLDNPIGDYVEDLTEMHADYFLELNPTDVVRSRKSYDKRTAGSDWEKGQKANDRADDRDYWTGPGY